MGLYTRAGVVLGMCEGAGVDGWVFVHTLKSVRVSLCLFMVVVVGEISGKGSWT